MNSLILRRPALFPLLALLLAVFSPACRADATRLIFWVQPGGTAAGMPLYPQPVVRALNADGTLATAYSGTVTLGIKPGSGAAGASLTGGVTANVVNGMAQFANLSIDTPAYSYILTATSGTLAGASSAPFNVSTGATRLAFITSPAVSVVGSLLSPLPAVAVLNDDGTVASNYNGSVTLSIKSGTGTAGAQLTGTKTVSVVNGVARFTNLAIDKRGSGYVLAASGGALSPDESAPFNVNLSTPFLVFTTQPGGVIAGQPLNPQPVVQVFNNDGTPATTFNGPVTVALKAGSGAPVGQLTGMKTVTAQNGVATFGDLSIDTSSVGYTPYILTASSPNLAGDESQPFDIAAPPVVLSLSFQTQPGGSVDGALLDPQPIVYVVDDAQNLHGEYTSPITVSIQAGTGAVGATLLGTTTITPVNGIAAFTNLKIDRPGNGYVLIASGPGVPSVSSRPFSLTSAATTPILSFALQPSGGVMNQDLSPQPTVYVKNPDGTLDTSYRSLVTLTIETGTGTAGGVLSTTTSVTPVNGVASFSHLQIDKAGTGYVLQATAPNAIAATGQPFNVTIGLANHLGFSVQPGGSSSGQPLTPQPVVVVQNSNGSVASDYHGQVTLSIKAGTGTAGAFLLGTKTLNAVSGVATFTDIAIDQAGSNYVLVATSGSLTSAQSSVFNVTAPFGDPSFVVRPSGALLGGKGLVTVEGVPNGKGLTGAVIAITFDPSKVSIASGGANFTAGPGWVLQDYSLVGNHLGMALTNVEGQLYTGPIISFGVTNGALTGLSASQMIVDPMSNIADGQFIGYYPYASPVGVPFVNGIVRNLDGASNNAMSVGLVSNGSGGSSKAVAAMVGTRLYVMNASDLTDLSGFAGGAEQGAASTGGRPVFGQINGIPVVAVGTDNGRLVAYDTSSGSPVVSGNVGGRVVGAPAIDAATNSIFASVQGPSGPAIVRLGTNGGTGSATSTGGAGVSAVSSPLVSLAGTLLAGTTEALLSFRVEPGSGALTPQATVVTGESINASPVVVNGSSFALVGAASGKVYRVNFVTGTADATLGRVTADAAPLSDPFYANNIAYFGGSDGSLYKMNPYNLGVTASTAFSGSPLNSPVVTGSKVYVADAAGRIGVPGGAQVNLMAPLGLATSLTGIGPNDAIAINTTTGDVMLLNQP